MRREKFYDVMVTIFSSAIIGFFVWFLTIEKKIPILEKDVEKNSEDIKEIKVYFNDFQKDIKNQNEQMIKMLHSIELQLKDKKDKD